MHRVFLVIFSLLCWSASGIQAAQPPIENPVVKRCTVSVKDEIEFPAQDAGVLVEMNVKEGDSVEKDDLIAKIDVTEAEVQKRVAENAQKRAKEQATNQVEVLYAEKAAGVAQLTYEKAKLANDRARRQGVSHDPYPEIEVRRLKLDAERAQFQTQIAEMNQRLAGWDEQARAAELEGAEKALARRQLIAPFDGQVVNLYRRKGEWVKPGDPILTLMYFKTMEVTGEVDATQYSPSDVADKPVTVEVALPRDRVLTLEGTVRQIRPVLLDNKFFVTAEVPNVEENGHWLVLHGAQATMTIHVK